MVDNSVDQDEGASLPLAGIKVLDLTRALAGPFCTALLGDFGADVIKVEGLPLGDPTRNWPPYDGARSLYYLSTNRNKRSVAVDLRAPEVKQILQELVADADVLVENFRPHVLRKLGLDPERLRQERPDLVISSVTGFGETGPLRDHAGLDQVAQGMSGMMSVTGAGDRTPMRAGVPVADLAAGMFSAFGIAASLVGRSHGSRAVRVSTSLLESAISLMTFQAQRFLSLDEVAEPQGNDHPLITPYGAFGAADAAINVAVGTESQWAALCNVLGKPQLAVRAEYAEPALRTANREALKIELNALFESRTVSEWMVDLRAAGVPCGPIYRMDEVFADPQVDALGVVQTAGQDGDVDRLVRGPLWADGVPSAIHRRPPVLGEHTKEVLAELGYGPGAVEDLLERGVVLASEASRSSVEAHRDPLSSS